MKLKKITLLIGDVAILYISLYLTLAIRYWAQPIGQLWENHLIPFSAVFIIWILIFYISNLYDLNSAVNNIKFFQITGKCLIIAGIFSVAFFYLNPNINIAPKRNLLIYIAVFAVLFFLWRNFFNLSLKSYFPKNNIAIIGLNAQVRQMIFELNEKSHLGFNVLFIIDDKNGDEKEINGIKIYEENEIKNIEELILKNKIKTIIIASDIYASEKIRTSLFKSLRLKVKFISLPNFYEDVAGKVPIEVINQMWFLENLNEGNKKWFNGIKRTYDFFLALFIFILTFLFWPIIGMIIKLESKGSIFFKQYRAGKDGKKFKIIKFRTMKTIDNNFSPTEKNDLRVTKFGNFLRKTRIDEMPQIINIIKGEMSFVGPRPERPELITELEKNIPFYNERNLVKPGVTGWDQVSGEYHSPSKEDTLKKIQYDLFYIKNRSIYLDLSIILKTIATILSRKGV